MVVDVFSLDCGIGPMFKVVHIDQGVWKP